MMRLPEGSAGRALAVAIAAAVVCVFYLAVVSPVLTFYNERAERLDQRAAMAQKYEALARDLPALRASDRKWRDGAGGELLLDGDSDALASASLQTRMKSLVEDAGARLSSAEVLPAIAEGNFHRVGLRVVFSGDLKLVTAVLRGVETSRPILSVGDFDLRAGSDASGSGEDEEDASAAIGGGDALAVTLDVYGFRAG